MFLLPIMGGSVKSINHGLGYYRLLDSIALSMTLAALVQGFLGAYPQGYAIELLANGK